MSKMSLEDSDTEGACACNFNDSSSDIGLNTRSTYLKLPTRVSFKSENSSSESDIDIRKTYLRLPFPSTKSNKTLDSDSSQSKTDIEDDYFPPYELRERVCKQSSMHIELYSTPPTQVPIIINHSKAKRVETSEAEKYVDTINQSQITQEKLLEVISASYNAENNVKVSPSNKNNKHVLEQSQLEFIRLQIKKELKRIEHLDMLLTCQKEKSNHDNYRFEKEMLLLETDISEALNNSATANLNSTPE